MPHNFTRPTLPYANVSLPNDNRFQVLTRVLNSPPTDLIYDTEYNYLIDGMNQLDTDIINVAAGKIPGSSDPANADGLVTTDGAGNLSFVKITNRNVTPASLPGSVLINSSVTGTQIGNGAITNNNLSPLCVATGNIQDDAIGTDQIQDQAIGTDQIQDQAIGTNELALLSVTAPKIANQTITATQIANNTITDGNILGPVSVTKGGTGNNTLTTSYGLLTAGTSPTSAIQNVGTGTLGQTYTSGGNDAIGTWQNNVSSKVLQVKNITNSSILSVGTSVIPRGNSIPQSNQGTEVFNLTITPTNVSNILYFKFSGFVGIATGNSNNFFAATLFQNPNADAIATNFMFNPADNIINVSLQSQMIAGTTSATTFQIRVGPSISGTYALNTYNGVFQIGGGTCAAIFEIWEVQP